MTVSCNLAVAPDSDIESTRFPSTASELSPAWTYTECKCFFDSSDFRMTRLAGVAVSDLTPAMVILLRDLRDLGAITDEPLPEWRDMKNPPSEGVRTLARKIGRLLAEQAIQPSRIVPSEDGEISYYFFVEDVAKANHPRYASITCYEDDELVLLTVDRTTDFSDAVEFSMQPESLRIALDTLTRFIEPCLAL